MNQYNLTIAPALRLLSRTFDSLAMAYPELKFTIDFGIRELSLDDDQGKSVMSFEKDFFNDDVWKLTVHNKSLVPTVHHLVTHDHVPFHLPA